jgi:hypothetical protein
MPETATAEKSIIYSALRLKGRAISGPAVAPQPKHSMRDTSLSGFLRAMSIVGAFDNPRPAPLNGGPCWNMSFIGIFA